MKMVLIKPILKVIKCLVGTSPAQNVSPPEKGDHPEMDTSELCDEPGIETYQSLIGSSRSVLEIMSIGKKCHLGAKGVFGCVAIGPLFSLWL
jgi:hypothetical protein